MDNIRFREVQKFRQTWIWITVILASGGWLYMLIDQVILGNQLTKDPVNAWTTIVAGIIPLFIALIFWKMGLVIEVTQNRLRYRFSLLQRKFRELTPGKIEKYEIRQYKPIGEYGGWGIRIGRGKRGNAYNVRGNLGMQLYLSNGKKFLLGTQQPEPFKKAMDSMMQDEKQK